MAHELGDGDDVNPVAGLHRGELVAKHVRRGPVIQAGAPGDAVEHVIDRVGGHPRRVMAGAAGVVVGIATVLAPLTRAADALIEETRRTSMLG
jgi:hypothetical protein